MLTTISNYLNKFNILITNLNERKKFTIFFTFSLLIALFLSIRPIPWATDDINYLNYVNFSGTLLDNIFHHPMRFFVDEPLWLVINNLLGFAFTDKVALRIIIFASTLLALYSLGKLTNNSFLMLVFFLIIGEILAKYILHIRQGLAISVFLFGLTRKGNSGKIIRLLTPFIHTSFWIVVIYEVYEMFCNKLAIPFKKKIPLFIIVNMMVILLLPIIATWMNDRRVGEYNFSIAPDASGNGFIFWILLGAAFIFAVKKDYLGILGTYGIIFYLESYFFLEFSPRILENFLPIIVVGMLNTKKKHKIVLCFALLIYSALGWYFRGGFHF